VQRSEFLLSHSRNGRFGAFRYLTSNPRQYGFGSDWTLARALNLPSPDNYHSTSTFDKFPVDRLYR